MRSARLWALLGVMLAGGFPVLAQTNVNEEQGMKPYDSFHGGDLDSVSMTNGGMTLHIPLLSYPQRGHLNLGYGLYSNTKQWNLTQISCHDFGNGPECTYQMEPQVRGGQQLGRAGQPFVDGVYLSSSVGFELDNYCDIDQANQLQGLTIYNWSYALIAPDGNGHSFGNGGGALGCPGYPLRSLDASGIVQNDTTTVTMPDGTRFSYPAGGAGPARYVGPSSVTDTNGNQIAVSSSGVVTDTLGRNVPVATTTTDLLNCPSGTSSATTWNVPGLSGGTRTFKFCTSMVSIYTSFGGGSDYPPTNTPLLIAVVLPDLTLWTFAYDHWGNVTRLGLPTGGSISYEYGISPLGSSMVTTSRTVDANDGTGTHKWTYNYTATSAPNASLKVVITSPSPDFNDTVHTSTPVAGMYGSYYDTQVQYYQGSQSSGTLLKTATTQYSGIQSPLDSFNGTAANVVPIQVTTTTADGHTSKVISSWDTGNTETFAGTTVPIMFGSLLQRDEYDFSNVLVRSTVHHYLWQDDARYKANNLIALPVSSTLKDGSGCEMSKTSYGYDETYNGITIQPSLVTTQFVAAPWSVRGNLTSSSSWLISACAEQTAITSHTIPYDTGLAYQSYDPLGHFTQYTYSSAFAGGYLTQTNLPDTQMPDAGAPVVHHVISGNYDFNTGLLTSFTDENSQTYSYQYDSLMLRLTQGNHPDGGITKLFYPDPNTVERLRLITGTTYDDFKVKFDGVGRPYQTLQSTPDCASWIKVDTGYDPEGRAKTVSNPYCLTSEPTYGVSQTTFDALSRTLNTTKQDGSVTSVKYEDTPGDTSGAPLVCTTATDESGKKRQACSDAFGQLIKVIEPNPGSLATFAAGSVSVSGTEQSTGGAATSGTGTVTISGTEQSVCNFDSCSLPGQFTWDSGPVSITVNGVQKSVTYSRFSTPTTIATALAAAFHNDGSAPADATSSGAVVTLTARATGAATNYSLTVSASSSDPTDFTPPSFSITKSGANFTGGHDAGVSDSGNVTITLNGTNYTTAFGAGDTSTSIASRLATAVTAGPYASATSSAGIVNLTSKTVGSSGNFSLTASYTYNTGSFTQPSFTTSTSGPALANGKDASALNNTPFVTLYQYNARGNMLCVHQKATDTTADVPCTGASAPSVPATWRQRFFTYDSFSRLLTAMNPELNGTGSTVITYGYDNNSRLTSKIEPAPNAAWGSSSTVTVNYTYDALNRLLDTTFSDGTTLKASHRYDYATFQSQSFTNPIGREVAALTVNSSGSTVASTFASYDVMGRVANTVQCNPSVSGCKTFTAGYDKLGDLTTLAYPGNGFTVTYGYDSAARLTTATDSNGVIYAQTPTYLPSGAIQEFTSPNFANNKYHVSYNNRLQPIEIWAGSAQGSPALFDKQYSYGTAGVNNGNIYTITNVKDSTRTQSFTYDPLNRLITAGDNGHWANSYTYDAWGNLTNKTPGSPAGENMNQPADANNHLSGLTYDAAGNVINDGLGGVFVFDGENRIKTAGSVTYTYDADGRRIQKSTGINYWYGPGGQALAETDSAGNWTNYIFFGGQRLARNIPQPSPNPADIKYYITDHLHSTAMFVDKAGTTAAILDDNDMYPWGGVVPGVGKTTSNNTIKFTGQYRDTDTGANLDYFGARYYSNTIGRFMNPDWAATPTTVPYAKLGDPQSLNLYAFAGNMPITRVENGHNYAGMNGYMADTSAGLLQFNEDHGKYGVDADYDQLTITSTISDAASAQQARAAQNSTPPQGAQSQVPQNPCAGVSPTQFDYSRIGNDGKTIRQHIEKGHMVLLSNGRGYQLPLVGSKEEGNGQYRFTPQGPTPDANFAAVQEINAITFLSGTFKTQGGYTVYEHSLTSAELYSISRPLGQKQVSFFVGDAQPAGWKPGMGPFLVPTPTNRFVVNSACQPVTGYPIIQ
jgi:RHS repeat-associated protein